MKVRYVIKYTKESNIKFVGHLDLLRTLQRIIRRADLPVDFSKGFNPHMSVSIAQPLSVGMYSGGEYMDIVFTEKVSTDIIKKKLVENAPSGIKILDVFKIREAENNEKIPQTMALIDGARYTIKIKYKDTSKIDVTFKTLLNEDSWMILKKTKSGENVVNIKPMIKTIEYSIQDSILMLKVLLSCGSKENLSAELFSQFIKENMIGADNDAFVDIKREEMYAYKDKKLVSLSEYVISM